MHVFMYGFFCCKKQDDFSIVHLGLYRNPVRKGKIKTANPSVSKSGTGETANPSVSKSGTGETANPIVSKSGTDETANPSVLKSGTGGNGNFGVAKPVATGNDAVKGATAGATSINENKAGTATGTGIQNADKQKENGRNGKVGKAAGTFRLKATFKKNKVILSWANLKGARKYKIFMNGRRVKKKVVVVNGQIKVKIKPKYKKGRCRIKVRAIDRNGLHIDAKTVIRKIG